MARLLQQPLDSLTLFRRSRICHPRSPECGVGNSSGQGEAVGESGALRHGMGISDGSLAWPKEHQRT